MQTLIEQLDPYWNQKGGVTKLAKILGESLSTVHSWKRRRSIPHWRVAQVEDALRTHEEFKDLNASRQVG
jgi:uncharacterized protein YjcR